MYRLLLCTLARLNLYLHTLNIPFFVVHKHNYVNESYGRNLLLFFQPNKFNSLSVHVWIMKLTELMVPLSGQNGLITSLIREPAQLKAADQLVQLFVGSIIQPFCPDNESDISFSGQNVWMMCATRYPNCQTVQLTSFSQLSGVRIAGCNCTLYKPLALVDL